MAPAISKPLLSDLVAQTAGQVPSIRPVGDRPADLANVDNESGAAGIPLVDLKKLNPNGPESRKVVEAIGRACESDGFFMVTNHGVVPAPAGVVEGMLRVDGELFHFHLPEYSDDPNKAAEARALLEALSESLLGLELERSHMGRHAQPHTAVNYYPPCPQPDPHAIITQPLQDQQDGVSGLQVQRGSRWVTVNPVPANALVISIGDQLQAIGLSTSFNVRPHCYGYPLESFVDQWPSNPPSSFRQVVATYATEARALPLRLLEAISECVGYSSSNLPYSSSRAACNVWGDNIHRAIQRCVRKLGCSSPSYCLPITVSSPSFLDAAPQPGPPHGSETESPFSPVFILQKNNVKVEVITNEATSNEDVSKFDLATIAGTLSLLVPMAINIDGLTTSWGRMGKVLCGIFMIMSLILALIGLFTASFREGSRARNLSSHCARLSLLGATIVFVLLIASKLGCVGCAAGVALVLVMLALTVLWIRSEEPTGRAAHEV